jgi:hypothetical protein
MKVSGHFGKRRSKAGNNSDPIAFSRFDYLLSCHFMPL